MSEAKIYKFTLEGVPASANTPIDDFEELKKLTKSRRPNKMLLQKLKRKWQRKALKALRLNKIPKIKDQSIVFKIFFYHAKFRNRDSDNYYLVSKGILDAIIEDDSNSNIEWLPPSFLIDMDTPRTEVVIRIIDKEELELIRMALDSILYYTN